MKIIEFLGYYYGKISELQNVQLEKLFLCYFLVNNHEICGNSQKLYNDWLCVRINKGCGIGRPTESTLEKK